jgi:hypothetical protein
MQQGKKILVVGEMWIYSFAICGLLFCLPFTVYCIPCISLEINRLPSFTHLHISTEHSTHVYTMPTYFPVLLRKYIDSADPCCACIQWSVSDHGTHMVCINDNAAFSRLYGYRKSVWAKQFNAYGFKNIHKGHTQQQKASFTFYYHSSFTAVTSLEQIQRMRKSKPCKKKAGVCFTPSGEQFQHILQQTYSPAQDWSSIVQQVESTMELHQLDSLSSLSMCSFDQLCLSEDCDPLQLMRSTLMTPARNRTRMLDMA